MRLLALMVLGYVALGLPDAAAQFCYRPDPPTCVRYLMPSSASWEFEDCRNRLTRFQREVSDYNDCIRADQQQLLDELDRAIRRFNACARDRFC